MDRSPGSARAIVAVELPRVLELECALPQHACLARCHARLPQRPGIPGLSPLFLFFLRA